MKDIEFQTNGGKGIVMTSKQPITGKQDVFLSLSTNEEVVEFHKKLGEFIENQCQPKVDITLYSGDTPPANPKHGDFWTQSGSISISKPSIQVLLNQYDDPKLSEQIFVGVGDIAIATHGTDDFGFTPGKEYEIKGISPYRDLIMQNDKGEEVECSVEYFTK